MTADPEEIVINRNEVAQRLHTVRGYTDPEIQACEKQLMSVIRYQCAYILTPIDLKTENVCDFGFMTIPSKVLYKNLQGCDQAYVMAMTSGIAVDRLLARLNILSQAQHFMTDGLSSAAIESFCNHVCRKLREEGPCVPRFSPGYADVPLTFQVPLLQRLHARELLGITLNAAYLMTPVKSITAVMGKKSVLSS